MPNTVGKKREHQLDRTMARWENAERGTGGLRCVRYADFIELPNDRKIEALSEPTILMNNGVESVVVMTVEHYYAMLPPTVSNKRQPSMVRLNGVLFREVV